MAKKVLMSLVAVIAFVGTVAGLLVDVPQILQAFAQRGPDWLTHPDTWWLAGCAIVTALLLLAIWAPWKTRSAGPLVTDPELQRVDKLLSHVQTVVKKALAIPDANRRSLYMDREIGVSTPFLVKALFGKKDEARFIEAMGEVRQKSGNDCQTMLQAYSHYLGAQLVLKANKAIDRLT